MKTAKKQSDIQILFTKGKRVSLRCPLSIDRTDAEVHTESASLQVNVALSNNGGGGLTNDTAESIIIVLRLYDQEGNSLPCAGNDYLAKSILLGADGLAEGGQISFRVQTECPSADAVSDLELYISRVRYADGTLTDYMRGDFFDVPNEAIPLAKKFKKNMDEVHTLLGHGAIYLPEQLTEIVWRCTCGEFAESDVCPVCARKKAETFHALEQLIIPALQSAPSSASEETVTIPLPHNTPMADGKTAEYSINSQIIAAKADLDGNAPPSDATKAIPVAIPAPSTPPKKRRRKHRRSTIALLIAIGISSAVLFVLVTLLIVALQSRNNPPQTTTDSPASTQPAPEEIAEQIVRTYLDANDFDNALGFAKLSNLGDDLLNEIYTQAILYYSAQEMPEKALEYAKLQNNTEKINELLALIFDKQLAAGDYEGAMNTADSLPEAQKVQWKQRAAEGYVKKLVETKQYADAMNMAKTYETSTTPKQISQIAIGDYLTQNDYDGAMKFANSFQLGDQIPNISKKAALYYSEHSNLAKAIYYLRMTEDEEITQSIYVKLNDTEIRRYLPTFFQYLDFSKKQAVHASPITAQSQKMIVLDQMGNVFQGEEMIYDAAFNEKPAVSVAACDTVVIALFADGTVQILSGENANFSQTDLEDWHDVVAISVSNYHILALTQDGKVLSAGKNNYGQCETDDIENAVMISAGANHSLILLANGTVVAQGLNLDDEHSVDDWSDIVAISAGVTHSIGIRLDGTAVSIGNCDVSDWRNVIAVVSGGSSAVAITADHKVYYNASGKPSYDLASYTDVLWVSVRQNFVGILHIGGNLSGIGLIGTPPAGIPLYTDLFGMK